MTTEAQFDKAVNALNVDENVKLSAINLEANGWGNDNLPMTVGYGSAPDTIEFTVHGTNLSATELIGPTQLLGGQHYLETSFPQEAQSIVSANHGNVVADDGLNNLLGENWTSGNYGFATHTIGMTGVEGLVVGQNLFVQSVFAQNNP